MGQTSVGSHLLRDGGILREDMSPATICSKKVEFAKTSAPTVNDDNTQGYAVASRWLDTTTGKEYVCLAAGTGSAVWKETTSRGINVLSYLGF